MGTYGSFFYYYFIFFKCREPGSPLSSVYLPSSADSVTAPRPIASRGATNHSTTTLTHQPHSTRVYYHTTIFQPNTVNREYLGREAVGNVNMEQVEGGGQRLGKTGREGE